MITTPTTSTSAGSNSAGSTGSAAILSADDFLQILVAEFRNQDPTQPSDPTQYATQLVQFANLGQLQSIDRAVQQPSSTNLMQAASAYIGREVVAPGDQVGVQNGTATSIAYAPVNADSYKALVFNAAGQLVDNVSLGDQPAGSEQTFTWRPPSGTSDGTYQVSIVNSSNVALNGLLEQGVVKSVSLTNGGVALNLGNLSVAETSVASVAQPQ